MRGGAFNASPLSFVFCLSTFDSLALLALTSSFYLSNASVSRVDKFQTLDLHVSNGDLLTETKLGNVDVDAIRECGVDTLNFEFAHVLNQFTTGFNTLSETVQLNRDLYYNRLLLVHCEEVNMQRFAVNRVELQLFNDSFGLGVTDGQINNLGVRAVDELANVSCCYCEGGVQTTTVDVARNQFLCAKSLSGLLTVLATRSTY